MGIYGRIATMELFRPQVQCYILPAPQRLHGVPLCTPRFITIWRFTWLQGERKDLLFLSTERYKFCVLEYDSATGGLGGAALKPCLSEGSVWPAH